MNFGLRIRGFEAGRLVAWMMKAMYDAGIYPLIEKLEKQVTKRP